MATIVNRTKSVAAAIIVFAAVAGPAKSAAIVSGSSLLSLADVAQLETWLCEGPLTLTNIFTKGIDGSTGAEFHTAADGQGRTFSVMQYIEDSTPSDIVGGYNPQSWDSDNHGHSTGEFDPKTAFLFNLSQSFKLDQTGPVETYNFPTYGPVFGSAFDLYVTPGLETRFVAQGSFNSGTTNILGDAGATYKNSSAVIPGSWGKIEVFTIASGTSSEAPEPATLAIFGLGLAGLDAAPAVKRTPAPSTSRATRFSPAVPQASSLSTPISKTQKSSSPCTWVR